MKLARPILCAALAVALGSLPLPMTSQVVGQVMEVPAVAGPATKLPADTRIAAQVQAVRQAQDPSAAIQAYQDASAVTPGNLAVEQAYVARMVDFGLPEMADVQAQDVIRRDPQDGLAWSVAAYMSAKRGQNDLAIRDVATAVRLLPDHPFVLRTAGQLAAWYDKADKAPLPNDVKASMESVKSQLGGNPAYADAYGRASDTYRELAAAPSTATQPVETTPATPIYTSTPPSGDYGTAGPYESYPSYYYPEPYGSYPYYQSWAPAPVWGGAFWWPTFTSVVIVDKNVSHCDRNKFDDCFRNGRGSFSGRHGNDFAFTHHNTNNVAFAGNDRGAGLNTVAVRDGTTFSRTDGAWRNRFAGNQPGLRDGRVIASADRSGGAINRTTIPGTMINRTQITPPGQTSMISSYRQTSPSFGRISPLPGRISTPTPINISRPGATPYHPAISAPHSMPSGGSVRIGGGSPFGGGGGHVVSGGHVGGGGGHGGR